ncbi:GMC oxidoreductase [Sinorhizobium meliloti]|nr:GMC oxidoreductase [Sinorhizobium meliloti]WKL40513.1 GMC oxidoreductase [Sinorhizobium meliloti]
MPINDPWPETLEPISQPLTPPVSYQLNGGNPDQSDWENMPAAASSFNVGGMGAHWTCCTPRPTAAERIPFIDETEWDSWCTRAEQLLKTNQTAFTTSLRAQVIQETLASMYGTELPTGRGVQMLPLACERINETWVEWTGVDTILGSLADTGTIPAERFELRAEHLCEELWSNVLSPDDKDIVNTSIRNLKTGEVYAVIAKVVIVAANAFNTPQLLWKSGIRPTSLGHYLNDQPMAFCQIVLSKELQAEIGTRWEAPDPSVDPVPIPVDDPIPNVWIPFSDPEHPYHCQIHRDAFAYSILPGNLGVDHRAIVGMRWFMRKEIRFEDYISFSDTNVDMFGMPQVTIHYSLSETDAATVHAGMKDMVRAAQAIGAFLPGVEPQILPRGSSLHVQGTYRMGESADTDDSVCDPYSRVWGYRNLYLGGQWHSSYRNRLQPDAFQHGIGYQVC